MVHACVLSCLPPSLQGLVVRDRWDAEHLADHKLPYAQVCLAWMPACLPSSVPC
jgi:hypothetical protein